MDIKTYDKESKTTALLSPLSRLIASPYPSIWVLGPHKSGKTTAMRNVVDRLARGSTNVHVFSTSIGRDDMIGGMIDDLTKKGIVSYPHHSIYRDDGSDRIADIAEFAKHELADGEAEDEEIGRLKREMGSKVHPAHLVIIDDLSAETRVKSIPNMLRFSRHGGIATVICSHTPTNILPENYPEFDLICMYPGLHMPSVRRIVELSGMPFEWKQVWEEYQTLPRFSCLTLDRERGKTYRNFHPPTPSIETSSKNVGDSPESKDVGDSPESNHVGDSPDSKDESRGLSPEEDPPPPTKKRFTGKISPSRRYVWRKGKRIPFEVAYPDLQ